MNISKPSINSQIVRSKQFELVGEPGEPVESVFPKLGKHIMVMYREKGDYFMRLLQPNLAYAMCTRKRIERNIAFRKSFPHKTIITDA